MGNIGIIHIQGSRGADEKPDGVALEKHSLVERGGGVGGSARFAYERVIPGVGARLPAAGGGKDDGDDGVPHLAAEVIVLCCTEDTTNNGNMFLSQIRQLRPCDPTVDLVHLTPISSPKLACSAMFCTSAAMTPTFVI